MFVPFEKKVPCTEYGVILYWKKMSMSNVHENQTISEKMSDLEEKIMKIDFATMIMSFVYFITFVIIYWIENPLNYLTTT